MYLAYDRVHGFVAYVGDVDNPQTFREDRRLVVDGRTKFFGLSENFTLTDVPSGSTVDVTGRYKVNHEPFVIYYSDAREWTAAELDGKTKDVIEFLAGIYGMTGVTTDSLKQDMISNFINQAAVVGQPYFAEKE